jgi:hypothetical protein
LEPQRFQKVRPVEILYEVPIFSGTIKWGCSGCGQEDFEHSLYIHMCLCIYIYNINAFRDHLGIEASGFHASPWTMHIADIYSTEAARFTLQQLQHDQYRQLIGNIYICIRCSHAMLWVMRSLSHLRFRLQQAELRSLCGALLCPTVQHRISAEEVGCPEVCGSWNIGGTQNR